MAERESAAMPHVSARWLAAIMALLFVVQIVLYRQSFLVEPAGDDFNAPLAEIWRGATHGPMTLLLRSAQPHNYRPLQSLAMWAFGSISHEHRLFWIHALQFGGMAVFAFAGWLWLRRAPVSTLAAACGAAALFLHPVLVAPLGGIDGFGSLYSTGLAWIAVYVVWAKRDQLRMALPAALVVFVVAIGFKEYALAAVPLACLAMLCFSESLRMAIGRSILVGAAFSAVMLAFIVVRHYTIPPPKFGYLKLDAITWASNATLFAGVLLFPGSTKWMFLNRSPTTLAITGASIALVGCMLLAGIIRTWRGASVSMPARDGFDGDRLEVRHWTIFAALGVAGASFPAVLTLHVSEMYAAGMVLPLAMLVALSAEGFLRMRAAWRIAGAIVLIGALTWAALAVRSKVTDLRDQGARARMMLEQVLALLPEDAHDLRIAVCYPSHHPPQPKYSVFQHPDDLLIDQPQALWWLRPHRGLWLDAGPPPTLDEALAHSADYALILQWNVADNRMDVVRSNMREHQSQ